MEKKKESLGKKFSRAYSRAFNTNSGAMAGIFAAILFSVPGSLVLEEDASTKAPQQDSVSTDAKQAALVKKVEQIATLESMANSFAWGKKERIVAERNYQQAVLEFQAEVLLDRKISEDTAEEAVALLRDKTDRLPSFAAELQSALAFRDEARAEFADSAFQALPLEQQAELVKASAVEKNYVDSGDSLWSALGMGFGSAAGIFGLCLAGNKVRRRFDAEDRAEFQRLRDEEHKRWRRAEEQNEAEVIFIPAPDPAPIVKKQPDQFRL